MSSFASALSPAPAPAPAPAPVHLPVRPWTRDDVPLVWRSDSSIEIGWPPRHVRLDGIDRAQVAWLLSLAGERELAAALEAGRERGLPLAAMRRLLVSAVRAGLVDDASAIPTTLRDVPLPLRDLVAGDVACARYVHGATGHARSVIDRRRTAEVGIQGDGPVADALAMVLTSSGVGSIVGASGTHSSSRRHRQSASERACHVLCGAPHPDAASDPDAMALDIPHLAVTAAGMRAVVGPLVIPGRTSCLRCRDLHLADADPAWPRIAVQWSRRTPGAVAAGLAHLAGSWAALQVLAVIDAGPAHVEVPTMDGALVIALPGAMPHHESRPAHPLCGCRWPETGGGVRPRTRRGTAASTPGSRG